MKQARHRTAERVARQTGQLVIAISQRRNVITVYKGNWKYILRDVMWFWPRPTKRWPLWRSIRAFSSSLLPTSALEFEDLVTLGDVTTVLQRSQMVNRIAGEISRYVLQLGSEGRLVHMQLEELMVDIKDEGLLVFKDYLQQPDVNPVEAWADIEVGTRKTCSICLL